MSLSVLLAGRHCTFLSAKHACNVSFSARKNQTNQQLKSRLPTCLHSQRTYKTVFLFFVLEIFSWDNVLRGDINGFVFCITYGYSDHRDQHFHRIIPLYLAWSVLSCLLVCYLPRTYSPTANLKTGWALWML
ncbi:hypothetical protein B0T26DRAFT_178657 [Lasiosphaeria miniovina]|uniref:Uncharacterized protein n=1 Tax=Lasiosphaeria miniovina TaxID=1954250 RepID=A0AA40E939_9PEZI|nr:uncharacterized protein B0T26DRAFT_178657 [Lasiosphaeria miniovina]KAK0728601.1 hypothetical protein B0T26DRAFT_178657 [Lasiosphaeria miniovina]